MKTAILIAISFWVLLLGPGLCLAGALEHACDDSPFESSTVLTLLVIPALYKWFAAAPRR